MVLYHTIDVLLHHNEDGSIGVYVKPIDMDKYLDFSSHHPLQDICGKYTLHLSLHPVVISGATKNVSIQSTGC